MQAVDLVIECDVSKSIRARQAASLFDVPIAEKARQHYQVELPVDETDWSVGLIVGASGSGKSTIARHVFGDAALAPLEWHGASCIDDFDSTLKIDEVTSACSSVGFNTVPAWMRPYHLLSNGEKFRVEMARRIACSKPGETIVVDEFTSLVDRQVATIASHSVQKFVRQTGRRFVAVTCHYDVIEWLQPEWVLDMSTRQLTRRLVQRRPELSVEIRRVPNDAWHTFAPFHYMSADLHRGAKSFCLFVNERPAAFLGLLWIPVSQGANKGELIIRQSRSVTLPDFQGLGLSFVLLESVAAHVANAGKRIRAYPKHFSYVRSFQRSPRWKQTREQGKWQAPARNSTSTMKGIGDSRCAVFEWVGPKANVPQSESIAFLGFSF